MKKILFGLAALYSSFAFSATLVPIQLLNPTGSSSGQAIVSTGASTAPAWGNVNAATLNGATFAAPGPIGSTTASTGAFTTLNASGNDALMYQDSNAQSIPNGTATTVTTWTKVTDRVNANFNASTGVFTAPATGQYWVAANLTYAVTTGGSGIVQAIRIVGNSVTLAEQQLSITTTTTAPQTVSVSTLVSLTAGQTIVIQAFQNSGSAVVLAIGSAYNNSVSITRIP